MLKITMLALLSALSYASCPRLEPSADCEPGASKCEGGRPYLCSRGPQSERRWTPTSSVCGTRGAFVCCPNVAVDGVVRSTCAPESACVDPDGGVR